DQRAAVDGAAMDDRAMPDGHLLGDDGRPLGVRDVDGAVVLDVGAGADADEVDVAADGGAVPDGTVVAELHIADDRGVLGDENTLAEARVFPFVTAEDHGPDFNTRPAVTIWHGRPAPVPRLHHAPVPGRGQTTLRATSGRLAAHR